MNHRNTARGRSRDLGLDNSAGKGDKDRTTNRAAFSSNFDAIDWGRPVTAVPAVVASRIRECKTCAVFAETEGEWPDVIGIGNHAPTTDIHRE